MKARKRFGQNFLHDQQVIQDIVNVIHPQESDHLVEIGPGQGALTDSLISKVSYYDAIEIDRDLIPQLLKKFKSYPNFSLHTADVLEFDFTTIKKDKELRIIGNLPYNISTPLLFHLLNYRTLIKDMHFMLQKEVVDRITAEPENSNYGRLSIMIQYFCQVEKLLEVNKESFLPSPKVESAFFRIIPYPKPPNICYDFNLFENIVKQAFNQRRKTLKNSLKGVVEQWDALGIDPQSRPEQLSVEDFVRMANHVHSLSKR